MEEKMKKFVELVKELKNLSDDIIENHEDELFDGVFDEIDVMSTHCSCCLNILKEEGVMV
jgi:hypothetical protein